MLEKPDLPDAKIVGCLRHHYGLHVIQVVFLPLGNDVNTAVYRAVTDGETPYFVKLRRGVFDETAVTAPKFLSDQGIRQIIAPIATRTQQLWARLDGFNLIVYPFIEGHDGWDFDVLDRQWVELGAALKAIHSAAAPPALRSSLPQETFSPQWRELVKAFQAQVERETFDDPTAAKLAVLLKAKRPVIRHLVGQAERLGSVLQGKSPDFVLCHADLHAWNILIDANGGLYIVDWDTLTLAPKERDLMFVGSGMGICDKAQEAALFYQGYGQAEIDVIALAYYRYERIVQDIAAYCEQILLSDEGGEDREEGLRQLTNQFLPNNVIEKAYESEKILPPELRYQSI